MTPLTAVRAVGACLVAIAPFAVGDPGSADQAEPTPVVAKPGQGDFSYDFWGDRWGQSLGDVPFGTEPDSSTEILGGFETPRNVGDQYAARIRALFTPAETGDYRFYVSGDDDARLFLNPDGAEPAGARLVGYVAGWTTYHQWDRYNSQRTAWFHMEAGTAYYMEAIGKEGSGDDNVSVAMQRTSTGPIGVVPAGLIEATGLGEGGWRMATPQGLPDVPGPLTEPGWSADVGIETLNVSWTPVADADAYMVRLEGGGQVRTLETDVASVAFDRLVPDTRYVLEVAPMNAGGRQAAVSGLWVTQPGPYSTPVAPAAAAPDARPSLSYDRWDTGWWTLTSIPDGLAPYWTGSLAWGFETPPMQGENHAARLRAVLTPQHTDDYTFHLSADDDARLLFNPDGVTAGGALAVASVAGWTQQYQWNRYDSQTSATFRLQAGRSYYIEAIAVHGLGLDHLEVGWSVPGGDITVIPADVLSPTHAGSGGWRRDATDLPLVPGKPKHLTVDEAATTLSATWEASTVDEHHGATVFYEVNLTGDGVDRQVLTAETELMFADLPSGGQFWIEVIPWNESGRGNDAAFTVHTDKITSGPNVGADDDDAGHVAHVDDSVPESGKLNGKQNERGDVVNQLGPVGVFEATGAAREAAAAGVAAPVSVAAVPTAPPAPAVKSGAKSTAPARTPMADGAGWSHGELNWAGRAR